jgi:hypothetical protein
MKVSEFTESFLSVPELDVENMPKIRFSEFMKMANTGDILLFSAGDSISRLIRRFTRSPYQHAAILLRERNYGDLGVFQSTPATFFDIRRKKPISGTQLNSARALVEKYAGKVVWRPLIKRNKGRDAWMWSEFSEAIERWTGKPYPIFRGVRTEIGFMKMAVNYILGVIGLGVKLGGDDERFCSELVADTLKEQGLIMTNIRANSLAPVDMSDWRSTLNDHLFKQAIGGDVLIVPDDYEEF